jgi:hypothetical protein
VLECIVESGLVTVAQHYKSDVLDEVLPLVPGHIADMMSSYGLNAVAGSGARIPVELGQSKVPE